MEPRLRAATSALIVLLAAVVVLLCDRVCRAQVNDDPGAMSPQARKHLELGLTHYQAKDYEEAIREFRAGYTLDPRPELLFAMAQAERLSGDCASAIVGYEKFLAAAPPEQQAAAARDALERCRIALGSGIRALEGEPSNDPDTRAAPALQPPSEQTAQHIAAAPAHLTNAGRVSTADDLDRPWYRDKVGAGLLGAGVATAAVGLGFYVASSSDEAAASEAPTYGEYQDLLARAESRRKIAWTGIAAGSVLISSAAIWYLLHRDEPKRAKRPGLGMSVGRSSAAVIYTAEF